MLLRLIVAFNWVVIAVLAFVVIAEFLTPSTGGGDASAYADLKNRYSVIVVSQLEHPSVNAAGAELFAALVTSPAGQAAIGAFGLDTYGEALFVPDAGSIATASE